jgi:hypothetical protein
MLNKYPPESKMNLGLVPAIFAQACQKTFETQKKKKKP